MADGLRLAVTTLTVLRVRGPAALDRRTAGTAMILAPLVGLLLGALAAAVLVGAGEVTEADLLPCALAVAALGGLTRGLHLDGLSDTADGLGSYAPPERAREIMKQPDVGALGMAAVLLVVLVQVAALLSCVAAGRGAGALVLAVVTARLSVTLACTPSTPAATTTGLGALVAGSVRPAAAVAATAVVVAAAAAYGVLDDDPVRTVLAVAAGLAVADLLRRHAVRRLGGLTGDVLGALVEVTTAVALVAMAVGT